MSTYRDHWPASAPQVSRSESMTLTLALAMTCWLLIGVVVRWVLG